MSNVELKMLNENPVRSLHGSHIRHSTFTIQHSALHFCPLPGQPVHLPHSAVGVWPSGPLLTMTSSPRLTCYPPALAMPHREKKVIAVLPAYNAEKTLKATLDDIPQDWVDEILLVDDCSKDRTVELARELGLHVVVHPKNRGYA